jgi:hypothetical protein
VTAFETAKLLSPAAFPSYKWRACAAFGYGMLGSLLAWNVFLHIETVGLLSN